MRSLSVRFYSSLLIIGLIFLLSIGPGATRVMEVSGVWPSPGIIYKGGQGAALTFNVTIGDDSVKWLLGELKEKKIRKATFFLDPAWVDRHADLTEELLASGYDIGIYDLHPGRYEKMTEAEMDRHISNLLSFFKEQELQPAYYRTKGALLSPAVVKRLRAQDLLVVDYLIDEKALKEKDTSIEGAVVALNLVNNRKKMQENWEEWYRALSNTKNVEYVSILELLASSDSKIKLLD
ncbi:polysaccharide deacetylase family protein [Jeotgalibacillus malaysiensis]|uniref:polysaccharide deacetylase family protein n=1 Tax=Jeotgalibacillus malaysiensis TaxID=1508404 RepID=UPI00384D6B5D